MALGLLVLLYIFLAITTVIVQGLLYKDKNETKNNIFVINMLFGILLAYLVYTGLPTNFITQRIIAIVLGLISVIGVILKLNNEKFTLTSKGMLSISVFGGLLQLFL